jgi:hypothetical protein
MPVRSVTNRYGGKHIIGQFPSFKMEQAIPFESTLEMDCLYLLDYDPLVAAFEAQPLTITYTDGQRTRHYTPDVLVRFHGSQPSLLLECKPEAQLMRPENQRKSTAAEHWCAVQDIRFAIVTEATLRSGYYLRNVKLLAQFARHPLRAEVQQVVKSVLETANAPVSLSVLAEAIAPEAPARATTALYTLLYHQHLIADLNAAPVGLEYAVSLPTITGETNGGENVHPFRTLLLG